MLSSLSEKFSRFKIGKTSYLPSVLVSQTARLRRPDGITGLL
jgi:hypothetical protein